MNPFWKSGAGKLTIAGIGTAVVAGGVLLFSKKTAVAPAPPVAGGAASPYYLFHVITPYASAGGGTGGSLLAVTTALIKAGFKNLQIEADPNNSNGWVASGQWTAPGLPALQGQDGTIDSANMISTVPPTPYTTAPWKNNEWYTFTVETEYPQGTNQDLQNTADLLTSMGFAAGELITPSANNVNRWNVAARWAGADGTSATDAPPLIIFVSPPGGSSEPIDAGPVQPPPPAA